VAKQPLSTDEKFQNIEFNLFEALEAIDKKDYGYYDRLTVEQQKKFVPFMLIHWVSAIKGRSEVQDYYLRSTDYHANKYLFNEYVQKHPKLVWMMLCASSPNLGKQFHQYIPHIKERVAKLKESPKSKDIKEYYKKVYPKASSSDIDLITEVFITSHKKKMYIANKFPELKFDEIELLAELITDAEIEEYEKDSGN
jgi:hypothetical protein